MQPPEDIEPPAGIKPPVRPLPKGWKQGLKKLEAQLAQASTDEERTQAFRDWLGLALDTPADEARHTVRMTDEEAKEHRAAMKDLGIYPTAVHHPEDGITEITYRIPPSVRLSPEG